ncbi:hypothetical protein DITRI_Ditri10aG0131500 [Diplodiscus trichospermus]
MPVASFTASSLESRLWQPRLLAGLTRSCDGDGCQVHTASFSTQSNSSEARRTLPTTLPCATTPVNSLTLSNVSEVRKSVYDLKWPKDLEKSEDQSISSKVPKYVPCRIGDPSKAINVTYSSELC